MIVVYITAAAGEFDAAVDYLIVSGQRETAGRFQQNVADAEAAILQFPNAHPPLRGGFRRILLARFAYQIVYRVEGDTIRIYAVAHLKRRPGYWRQRTAR
ncbi:MAG: type II toxin-antitoxin system RelE/ParE family toxin [Hyphomicrobium aestuarii]|nr:type II toxin-antitoxin system RelE/ParE family toxin [Hyphomicrobium aestuarii]